MVWKFKEDISQDALVEGFQNLCGLVINLNHTAANRYSPENASVVLGISHSAWLTLDLPSRCRKSSWSSRRLGAISTPLCPLPAICTSISARLSRPSPTIWRPLLPRHCAILLRYWNEVTGFRYWDGRSIIGFVDGTENPQTPAAREYFGIIGDSDPCTGAAATSSCRSTSTT